MPWLELREFYLSCLAVLVYVAAVPLLVRLAQRLRGVSPPYPPGPPGHLIWGNLADMQKRKPWFRYTDLSKEYGDIVHLSVLGQHVLILNTVEVANELLTKRSRGYSDRPHFPMLDLMGWDLATAFVPYGERWRKHRRVFQQGFNPKAIVNYRPVHTEKLHVYLNKLLTDPDGFLNHTHQLVATIILKIVYNHQVAEDEEDRLMNATQKAVNRISDAVVPGAWLVNSLPFLRFLPAWFPGCREFNSFAQDTRSAVSIMADESYEYAIKYSSDQPCLVTMLEELRASPTSRLDISKDILRDVCGTAFAAASETTILSLSVFFLAMRQFPEAQRKAQEELDQVLGPNRLPDYDDRLDLPYLEAVYREVMRWMPALPLSLAHSTSTDDIYKGYFIPEGAMVFSNVWAMTNDEANYAKPHLFMPERFLKPDGNINDDDEVLAFGFGRRICVGRHFADASLWRTIGWLLASFDIKKPKDDELRDLRDPRDIFSSGVVLCPAPFCCSVTPRSPEMANYIRNAIL